MDNKKIKALISLLDDEDTEVLLHVEKEILALGEGIIPFLENEWENNFNPIVQKRIEELIHTVHYDLLKVRLAAWKDGGGKDLLEGMWIIATYQYPDLEIGKLKSELDQIYFEAWTNMKNEIHPFDQVKILNNVIFSQYRFSANTKNFHSPSNSMINIVLESKKGNPITLCVIYLLIAQKLNMPVYGVNLPNLFILTYKSESVQFYINAFNKGLIFSKADIDNYLSHLNINPLDIFYQPCSNLDIVRRMLRNLSVSFEKLGDAVKVEEIKQLLDSISDGREIID
ncbi:MAG: transglutaminase family protein [Sporocytophaga sp.]|uniref:transglutaminase-like domain-containing protein n=1 Tax=Sporocytophaga sp. TaxID=2231183 RepID=UPI001B202374|nr:transglutaminase-like domain-containing protein [Sporocytophaga sp.]MBO9699456.1 transglutaminase family protein [Sporocytophaga sp.]